MQRRRLVRAGGLVFLLGMLFRLASTAVASHLDIQLTVEGQLRATRADADRVPPPSGMKPRPLHRVRRDQPVRFRWSVRNPDRRKKVEKLLIHLFLVRQARAGQKEVPDPQKGSVWETAFGTALEPGRETHGGGVVPVGEPGIYLLRIESGFTEQDHEHFAAIDLQVE